MSAGADSPRKLELLAPAKNLAIGIAAIDHGADAVYIGASAFGARAAAGNSIEDIRQLADYAHKFRARVYATVNTILYDSELKDAEALVRDLYRAKVDAVIVQDMSLLRLDLPPIELHASTQCDTRTAEKARFLQDVGFSQIVLARELTLREISEITSSVDVPVEAFIHGALCVSYSGRCHAGEILLHRSANRGKCPQVCRMPFDLIDSKGRVLERDKHLLSLKDFNASSSLEELVRAGVSSFKIEGRLKDVAYVKNITAYYSMLLDRIIEQSEGKYVRSSCGTAEIRFVPEPYKSFNRGFTDYFLTNRSPAKALASIDTPKSLGEPVVDTRELHNGDGISFFNPKDGTYCGFRVNRVDNGRIIPARPIHIPRNIQLYRTYDIECERLMARNDTAERKLAVDITIFENRVEACDERGCKSSVSLDCELQRARSAFDAKRVLGKLGGTVYKLRKFDCQLPEGSYIPPSLLAEVRRKLLDALDAANLSTYPFNYRRKEESAAEYPSKTLDYRDNVANRVAEQFFREHGVDTIQYAAELGNKRESDFSVIMTCRYCILRQTGRCLREHPENKKQLPLALRMKDGRVLPLKFDCGKCEMQVLASGK